jgi:dinuclear metal center YbgI/SA1388 family protein
MACSREKLLKALSELAPEHLAEPWDNVGLLIDPGERREFAHALLTIDLTEATLDEADELAVDFIVAYHPPLFTGLKRLRAGSTSEGLVVRALRAGLTVHSPHTALDAVPGGMTDWLAAALGPGESSPIVPHESNQCAGAGRFVRLLEPISVEVAVERAKAHLGLTQVRLAPSRAGKSEVQTLAVCPGAGGSVFQKVGEVDLMITGEMRHHDVLSRVASGTHVILTDHSNSERGYLPQFAQTLKERAAGLEVTVSAVDADPLRVT